MTLETKALLERIEASAEILNGFGGGGTWRAEPLMASIEGTWSIKRGTFGIADQLADVFAKVNYGEHDTQDAQGVAEAIVEARNTSRHLLTDAAAEIERLQAEVETLTEVVKVFIDLTNSVGTQFIDLAKEAKSELESREGIGE
jgi:hypothetical protein